MERSQWGDAPSVPSPIRGKLEEACRVSSCTFRDKGPTYRGLAGPKVPQLFQSEVAMARTWPFPGSCFEV